MQKTKWLFLIIPMFGVSTASQAQTINNTVAANACLEVVGVNCVTASGWSGIYEIVRTYLKSAPAASQTVVVQNCLIPAVRANTGLQFGIVDNVYASFGRQASSTDEYVWQSQFGTTWTTYNDLVKLVKLTPSPALPPAPVTVAPGIDPAAQALAVQTAFVKVFARAASQADVAQAAASRIAPAQAEGWVRGGLPRSATDVARVVDSVFPVTIGRSPTAQERASLIAAISSTWSGADDLTTYLTRMRASYVPAAPAGPPPGSTPFQNGQLFFGYNGIPLAPYLVGSGGYLVNTNGSNIVAQGGLNIVGQGGGNIVGQGGGNFVDPASKVLKNANGEPLNIQLLRAQGSGYLVNTNGSNIVAQGGGNIVAQGGGNIVAQGGLNIVGQGGGNISPIAIVSSYGLFNGADVTRYLGSLTSAISPNQIAVGQAVNQNAVAVGSQYSLKSVGMTPPTPAYTPGQVQITGPSQWTQGQPLTVTWSVVRQPVGSCAAGVKASVNSSVQGGNGVAISTGQVTLGAMNYAAGSSVPLTVVDGCTGGVISQVFPTIVRAFTPVPAPALAAPPANSPGRVQITGPAKWTAGQPLTITWSITQAPSANTGANCVRAMVFGSFTNTAGVSIKALQLTIPAMKYAKGTAVTLELEDTCSNLMISPPFTTVMQ